MMKYFDSYKGLPTELWIVFAATLVNRLGTMGLPFLLIFLIEKRSFQPLNASFVFSLYGISAVVVAPIAGWLCDRLGPIIIMQVALIGSGIALIIIPQVDDPLALSLCVVCWAVFGEAFRPANYAFVTSIAPQKEQKRFLSVSRLAVNLGMSLGPAVGGILAIWSFDAIFIVDGLTSVLAGGILLRYSLLLRKSAAVTKSARVSIAQLNESKVKVFQFVCVLLALLPAEVVFFEQQSVLPLYITGPLQLPTFVFGLAFTLNTILIIAFEVPLSTRVADIPSSLTTAVGALFIGLGFGLLAFVRITPLLILAVILWTFGEMLFLPGSAAYVAEMAPHQRKGALMGLYQMGLSTAFAISSIVGIGVVSLRGYPFFWKVSFCACLLSSFGLVLSLRGASIARRSAKLPDSTGAR